MYEQRDRPVTPQASNSRGMRNSALGGADKAQSGSRGGFPTGDKDEFSDALDRFRRELQHIDQRWKDGLAFHKSGLSEKYFRGNCAVLLDFHVGSSEGQGIQSSIGLDDGPSDVERVALIVRNFDVMDGIGGGHHCEHSMLVRVVETGDRPEQTVPSLVRFQFIKDEQRKPLNSACYVGISAHLFGFAVDDFWLRSEGVCELLPLLVGREADAKIPSDDLVNAVVECRPDSVNYVASVQDEGNRKGFSSNLQNLALDWWGFGNDPPIGLVLHPEFAEISLKVALPSRLKLHQVLIGPL